MAFKVITAMQIPDHSTIADFRRRHETTIGELTARDIADRKPDAEHQQDRRNGRFRKAAFPGNISYGDHLQLSLPWARFYTDYQRWT